MSFEVMIGLRYLRAKRRQRAASLVTVISITGVVLGVAALIITLALMTGFEEELRSKILGTNAHIVVVRGIASLEVDRPEELADRINDLPGVSGAAPFVYSKVMIAHGSQVDGIILKGIDPDRVGQVTDLEGYLVEGTLGALRPGPEGDDRPDAILLGKQLAALLGARPGDDVRIVSPTSIATPGGAVPRSLAFRVAGIFESGMFDYDSGMAYLSIPAARRLLGMSGGATGIEIQVEDIFETRPVMERIREMLGPSYWVRDWMDMNRSFFSALKLEKVVMFLVLLLIIIVAAFNIVGTLTMMVIEKQKDIGILKTMGARNRSVLLIFVLQGIVIGVMGTGIGLALGLGLSFLADAYRLIQLQGDVYFISYVPFTVRWTHVLLVCVSSLAISFTATIFPAYRASQLDPVEAIRYE